MGERSDISEDHGFKALCAAYPEGALAVFLPELMKERGQPSAVLLLQQETSLPDLAHPSRILDVGLHARWPDGREAIAQVEHWSRASRIDRVRMLWYAAALMLQHRKAVIRPIVLLTDRTPRRVSGVWRSVVAGQTTLLMRARIMRVTSTELPHLRRLRNRVARSIDGAGTIRPPGIHPRVIAPDADMPWSAAGLGKIHSISDDARQIAA